MSMSKLDERFEIEAATANDYIDGYKKIDSEKYRLIERHVGRDGVSFGTFPSDGLWIIKSNSRSSSRFMEIEKYEELPQKYPVAELALRQQEIALAISRYSEQQNETLLKLGSVTYSAGEMADFIIKSLVSAEHKGCKKKVLVEKRTIQTSGYEHKHPEF